jgi:hypothetical protein
MPGSIGVLIGTAVLGLIAIVFGVRADLNILLALGIADTFISLILIPVFYSRAKKKRWIYARRDALLVWQYAPFEAAHIAERVAKDIRKTSLKLSILVSICMAVIFAPFTVILEDAAAKELILYISITAVLLPFSSLLIAPAYTTHKITKDPSLTVIGRDYILLNNRYIGINDRASLMLTDSEVRTGGNAETGSFTSLYLTYTFRMRYGNIMHFPVEVPIPGSRTMEAHRFVETMKLT